MKINKENIFINARELFSTKGFKDTSVSDITKKTGIGVGSFYNFYSSKEEVFLEVFLRESEQMKQSIVSSVDLDADPALVIKEIISRLFAGIRENPILREWYSRDVYNKLEKYMTEDEETESDYSYNLFMEIITKWQRSGKIRKDIDSELVLAMFNSLSFIDLHKEEIGSHHFPQLLDYLVEFIVNGLRQ